MIIPEKDRKRQSYAEIKRDFGGTVVLLTEIVGKKIRPDSAIVAIYGDDLGDVIGEGNTLHAVDRDKSIYMPLKDFGDTGFIHMEVVTNEG